MTEEDPEKLKMISKQQIGQAVDSSVAGEVTHILQGVLTSGTGRRMGIGRLAAGKAGRCEGFSYAVFAGYTPDLAAAVWYGDLAASFGNPSPGIYGANVGPIWRASMEGALRGTASTPFTPRSPTS